MFAIILQANVMFHLNMAGFVYHRYLAAALPPSLPLSLIHNINVITLALRGANYSVATVNLASLEKTEAPLESIWEILDDYFNTNFFIFSEVLLSLPAKLKLDYCVLCIIVIRESSLSLTDGDPAKLPVFATNLSDFLANCLEMREVVRHQCFKSLSKVFIKVLWCWDGTGAMKQVMKLLCKTPGYNWD